MILMGLIQLILSKEFQVCRKFNRTKQILQTTLNKTKIMKHFNNNYNSNNKI